MAYRALPGVACVHVVWLQGVLAQCRAALKPDGLLLAAMFGGQTLQELRISCAAAAQERQGGISAVVSPMAQVRLMHACHAMMHCA